MNSLFGTARPMAPDSTAKCGNAHPVTRQYIVRYVPINGSGSASTGFIEADDYEDAMREALKQAELLSTNQKSVYGVEMLSEQRPAHY